MFLSWLREWLGRKAGRRPARPVSLRFRPQVVPLEERWEPSFLFHDFTGQLATGSAPHQVAVGPDRNLWFTEFGANKIGRMSTDGTLLNQFTLPTGVTGPEGIVAGPDGNMWVTATTSGHILRVNLAGTVTTFAIPTTGSQPQSIAVGPDNSLWFTEFGGNKIGKIALTGTITEFGGLTAGSGPTGITAGPDASLWFTERTGNRIGRITLNGAVSEFALPTTSAQPQQITRGPDGNLWFTENGAARIGQITTDGTVTEIAVSSGSQPFGITTGFDGNIWFTQSKGNRVGKVTIGSNAVTELALPSGGGPQGITNGPDGNLYFAESSSAQLGRLALPTFATGADAGGAPLVKVFDTTSGKEKLSFLAYAASFGGGVRVALGDVNNDGVEDIVTAPGPGGGPHVRVFSGINGGTLPGTVSSFLAFDPAFTGGVFVSAGDTNGDGFDDIVVGADAGGAPLVRAFSGQDGATLLTFLAYDPAFPGGVRVGAGDYNGDAKDDIVTGPGAGGGPLVRVFNGSNGSALVGSAYNFLAFDSFFDGGIYVAAGDVNGDGTADTIAGIGPGIFGPLVRAFDGRSKATLGSFFAYDAAFQGGVRVAATRSPDNLRDLIVTGAGPGGGPAVGLWNGTTAQAVAGLFAYEPAFPGGIFVG